MEELYASADLSRGQESMPVAAVNQYTFDRIPPFEYLNSAEIALDCADQFKANPVGLLILFDLSF